ncbi:MAG: hypothetical protein A3H28_09200 [Acidobacteria bacterium RIFCSPLOWO2_02_FULL_61_28]|nr:MAG: hypothetical protein A3H28_09200 [Acidobacteria bacterium RIFCSPLOWO2_02_FULL_61_28]
MMSRGFVRLRSLMVVLAAAVLALPANAASEEDLLKLYQENRPYAIVSPALFDQLGWDLPDGGATVKALADAAPGGAFDPRKLEGLPAAKLGYRAKWHEARYKVYGLDWEIGGLLLTPNRPLPGLPTIAIINGGSANWYEFYVDLFNNPGLGQYLAQKVPVFLITIPGNYKHGGWTEKPYDSRIPAYLLHQEISAKEAKLRNAVYTFRVVTEGVRQLIEKATTGPVVVVGHSTGGEIPFLLMETNLKPRLNALFLGWGSGGPAGLGKIIQGEQEHGRRNLERFKDYPNVADLRARTPDGEDSYVQSRYIGPLNPCKGANELEVAKCWFRQEERRRPQFKQVFQDAEHQGADALLDRYKKEVREALIGNAFGVKPEEVIADLFITNRAPLTGYKRMLWLVARLDNGHWNYRNPQRAAEVQVANEFRKLNPQAAIRVAAFDAPMTHYGHIERPKQLAGGLVAALRWLVEP